MSTLQGSVQSREHHWSAQLTARSDWTFHQIAPYIGRMKTSMARALLLRSTKPGELVVDPFCGSGVVALEAVAQGRHVVVGDWNPYAVLLTRAKLFAPRTQEIAEKHLQETWTLSRQLVRDQDLRSVPKWVRQFFHPKTLKNALAFRDACVRRKEHFLLACLLGILHHQRPGFLSYPSSHLVPYLRDRKYPKRRFLEMYAERDVLSRMQAKVRRSYRRQPDISSMRRRVVEIDARRFPPTETIDAVITSPPYMNELDYVRDNRLRLWFISRSLPSGIELSGRDRTNAYRQLMMTVCERLAPAVKRGGSFVLVVGDATRGGGRPGKTAQITKQLFEQSEILKTFSLEKSYTDLIPDVRRARREYRGTKTETIFIFRKA